MAEAETSELKAWIGRKQQVDEVLARNPTAALAATLNCSHLPNLGDPLPPLWHWVFFTPLTPRSELGPDGHPKLGGFMPSIPLSRRMWAGGRLRFLSPIFIGDEVSKETEITDISEKSGKQGALVFVTLRHRLSTKRGLAVEEDQDIVYRAPSTTTAPEPATAATQKPASWRDPMLADPVLLFRFSALTFNAHRIHYDLPYAQTQEGYPDLVVHGPLTATLLVERLRAHTSGRLAEFASRGVRPLFSGTPFHLCGELADDRGRYDLWAELPNGAAAMTATATVDP